ncbi:MAG: SDR family NAD(P)-dependent oxidoreductase, partial [Candidatus Accumulibacter sp.]|nr:SDR family NAD(P)-dependent oxidoreductase [Accumulibacter sp.]
MIVLITGASAGFGEAMARRFVAGGHRVIAAARRAERLAGLREALGEALLPVAMDVTDPASIAEGLARLPAGWQSIDVLVNNAGLALGTELAPQCSLAEWTTMIDTNVKGLVTLTHALLPGMVARNSG